MIAFPTHRRRPRARPRHPRARPRHPRAPHRHPREGGDPVSQRRLRMNRKAAAYWIVRSSRTMTAEFDVPSSLSSLPRRDDLDLIAAVEPGLCPFRARQHVVIQRDREMRTLIFELGYQRLDAT